MQEECDAKILLSLLILNRHKLHCKAHLIYMYGLLLVVLGMYSFALDVCWL